MLEFLPEKVKDCLLKTNMQFVYEIRLRANKPTVINYKGVFRLLGEYGLTDREEQAVVCDGQDIADCIFRAGNYSVYSVEEQIRQGFITAQNGERIGIAGEYVFEKGQPFAMRNFSSLCVRVPHEIENCGMEIYRSCMSDKLRSLLLCSPPGLGKTTILRDLSRIISEKTNKNVLICDERGEISCGNVGKSCDVLKFADKQTAFTSGIRALRPDVIITDELSLQDCAAVEKAIYAGVCVLSSAHFADMKKVVKPFFGLFERYVLLDTQKIGKIQGVYDATGRSIFNG